MKQVCAVVVTYNKLTLLKRAIGALRGSEYPLKEIIVVDNLSNDGTRDWLKSQTDLTVLLMDKNLGGAGGFHYGMAAAVERQHDWIWLMDDDSMVEPGSLTELIKATDENPLGTFYNSMVLWTDGSPCRMNIPKPVWEWTDVYVNGSGSVPLEACSFVSCLVNGAIARTVGLPVKEFFIWYDDFEYTSRLFRYGPGYFVPKSRVIHETSFNKGVNWKEVDAKSIWKYRHGIRNELSLISGDQKFGKVKAFLRLLECISIASANKPGAKVLFELWKAGIKGIFTDYHKLIEFAPAGRATVQKLRFADANIPFKSYPGEGWECIWGDDNRIMTHPAPLGMADEDHAYAEFQLPAELKDANFEAAVSLLDTKAHPVEFRAELRHNGQVVDQASQVIAPTDGFRLFTIPLNAYAPGTVLRLYATMSDSATNFFFASSVWHQPRIVVKKI